MKKIVVVWIVCLISLIGPSVVEAYVYPLKMSTNKRYLVDQNNTPFLMAGDSPQGLIGLSRSDQETYLASRAGNGINTIWVDAVCSPYSGICADATIKRNGVTIQPFTRLLTDGNTYDLSAPNELYFVETDAMINLAAKYGMTVLLNVLETGWWEYQSGSINKNGVAKAAAYGTFLGNRYKNFPNVIYFHGNDFQNWTSTLSNTAVKAIADGILTSDPNHIHTLELEFNDCTTNYGSDSLDNDLWKNLIKLNSSYSYCSVYDRNLKAAFGHQTYFPVYFAEGIYEFQGYQGGYSGPRQLRAQEYWSSLTQTTGQLYGNANYFGFGSSLNSGYAGTPGITQFTIWKNFFEQLRWWELVPDCLGYSTGGARIDCNNASNHTTLVGGYGTYDATAGFGNNSSYVTGARTVDGSLFVAYIPLKSSSTNPVVNMSKLSNSVTAKWFNPVTREYTPIGNFANTGQRAFVPPDGSRADNSSDWVLVLKTNTILSNDITGFRQILAKIYSFYSLFDLSILISNFGR